MINYRDGKYKEIFGIRYIHFDAFLFVFVYTISSINDAWIFNFFNLSGGKVNLVGALGS